MQIETEPSVLFLFEKDDQRKGVIIGQGQFMLWIVFVKQHGPDHGIRQGRPCSKVGHLLFDLRSFQGLYLIPEPLLCISDIFPTILLVGSPLDLVASQLIDSCLCHRLTPTFNHVTDHGIIHDQTDGNGNDDSNGFDSHINLSPNCLR